MDFKERLAYMGQIRYVTLSDGNIGTITNGGGLSMAICDLLTLYGSKPSNFLDLGGHAFEEEVYESFVLMQKDQDVTAIFVNVYSAQNVNLISK